MVSVFKYCHYLNLEVYIPTVKHHQTRRKKRYEFYDSNDELHSEEINKDNATIKFIGFLRLLFMLLHIYMTKCDKFKIKYNINKRQNN